MQRDRLLQDRIHRSFRRSENHLMKALTKRMGQVKVLLFIYYSSSMRFDEAGTVFSNDDDACPSNPYDTFLMYHLHI